MEFALSDGFNEKLSTELLYNYAFFSNSNFMTRDINEEERSYKAVKKVEMFSQTMNSILKSIISSTIVKNL